jgi:hypothetical protein
MEKPSMSMCANLDHYKDELLDYQRVKIEDLEGVVDDTKEALKELVSIIEIHQKATGNNFAWAELEEAKKYLN